MGPSLLPFPRTRGVKVGETPLQSSWWSVGRQPCQPHRLLEPEKRLRQVRADEKKGAGVGRGGGDKGPDLGGSRNCCVCVWRGVESEGRRDLRPTQQLISFFNSHWDLGSCAQLVLCACKGGPQGPEPGST